MRVSWAQWDSVRGQLGSVGIIRTLWELVGLSGDQLGSVGLSGAQWESVGLIGGQWGSMHNVSIP